MSLNNFLNDSHEKPLVFSSAVNCSNRNALIICVNVC